MKPHELANQLLAADRAKEKSVDRSFAEWWNSAMPALNHRMTIRELCRAAFKAGADAMAETLRLKSQEECHGG